MSILNSNFDNQICDYDFATDGGAVGIIRTGMIIPSWNLIPSLTFLNTLLFTSALGTATISVGWISLDQSPVLTFPNEFLAPVLASAVVPAIPFMGVHGEANPFRINLPVELIFSIGVEPLLSGRLMMFASYFNSDF